MLEQETYWEQREWLTDWLSWNDTFYVERGW
jgi:hypothetical protein